LTGQGEGFGAHDGNCSKAGGERQNPCFRLQFPTWLSNNLSTIDPPLRPAGLLITCLKIPFSFEADSFFPGGPVLFRCCFFFECSDLASCRRAWRARQLGGFPLHRPLVSFATFSRNLAQTDLFVDERLRSSWQATTRPVGIWRRRTALSVFVDVLAALAAGTEGLDFAFVEEGLVAFGELDAVHGKRELLCGKFANPREGDFRGAGSSPPAPTLPFGRDGSC